MTAPAPPLRPTERPEDRPHPVYWRHGLLALLPLTLAGYWPLWVCALLGALTWLGLRSPAWASGRLILFLLVVGVASVLDVLSALGNGPERLISVGVGYLVSLVLAGLLHVALTALEGGARRGLWLVLVPGLIAPQPWLVLGLAGGLLGRPGPDDRVMSSRTPPQRPVWAVVGGLTLAALLGGLLLPSGRVDFGSLVPAQQAASVPGGAAAPEGPVTLAPVPSSPGSSERSVIQVQVGEDRAGLLGGVISLALGLGLVVSLLLYRRMTFGRAHVPLPDRLVALGLILTFVLTFLAALLMGFTRSGGEGETASSGPLAGPEGLGAGAGGAAGRDLDLSALSTLTSVLLILGLLALIALALLALRARASEDPGEDGAELEPPALAPPGTPALHRVRLAYRAAQAALLGAGYGRRPDETPGGYAARLGAAFPQLAAPLGLLTRAYAPVRYGDDVSDEDAESAEAAARDLADLALGLPPPADPVDEAPDRNPAEPTAKLTAAPNERTMP